MSDSDEGIDLEAITDEQTLHRLLDSTDDFDERKMIRARLQEVQKVTRAKRDEHFQRREDSREVHLQKKMRDADQHKQRTLAMYDQMAKSSPAGAPKTMDVSIMRDGVGSGDSGRSTPIIQGSRVKPDLVEETIRNRIEEADNRKKRILAAFDAAAKSGPAGSNKIVDFNSFKRVDVTGYEPSKPVGSCTFGMSGGVPQIKKVEGMISMPPTPTGYKPPPAFEEDDAYQRMVKARQREADENKRKILAGYDLMAKRGGPGPKRVIPEELKNLNVDYLPPKPRFSCTSGSPAPVSARAKFQQMDSAAKPAPNFARGGGRGGGGVARSATDIKEMLLTWAKSKTQDYENVKIENFSTSWSDGLAFCALIHHFYPDAFDFGTLNPKNRRHNFSLAFRVAEERGDISPLLDVEDMVIMKKPDWKCVFTYVQSLYRHLHDKD